MWDASFTTRCGRSIMGQLNVDFIFTPQRDVIIRGTQFVKGGQIRTINVRSGSDRR